MNPSRAKRYAPKQWVATECAATECAAKPVLIKRSVALMLFLLVLSSRTVAGTAVVSAPDVSQVIGKAIPPVSFQDDIGRTRDLKRFEGQPLIILPVYSSCHGSCSQIAINLKQAIVRSGVDPRTFQVFVFSFDPSESIRHLREFREKCGLPASWTLGHLGYPEMIQLTSALDYRTVRDGQEWIHPNVAIVLGPNLSVSKILNGPYFTEGQIKEGLASSSILTSWRLRYGPYLFAFSSLLLILSATAVSAFCQKSWSAPSSK